MKIEIKREYYSNGQLKYEIPCRDGSYHGLGKVWYSNGQLYHKTHYQGGQCYGPSKGWSINGQLNWEGEWRGGHKVYKMIYYTYQSQRQYYLYGEKVSQEEYRRHELVEKLAGLK